MRKLLLPVTAAVLSVSVATAALAGMADMGGLTEIGGGMYRDDETGCVYTGAATTVETVISDNGEVQFGTEGRTETTWETETKTDTAFADISQEYSDTTPSHERSQVIRETLFTDAGTVGHYENGTWLWVREDGSTVTIEGGENGGVGQTYTNGEGHEVTSYRGGADDGFTQTVDGNTTYHVGGGPDDADSRELQARMDELKGDVSISKDGPGTGAPGDDGGQKEVVSPDGHYEYMPGDWVWDRDQTVDRYNITVGDTTFQVEAVANGKVTSELRYTSADGVERTSTGTTECTFEKRIVKKMYLWECSGPESYGSEEYELSSGVYWNTFTQHGDYVITVTPKYYWEIWKHTKVTYLKESGSEWVSDEWTEEIDELDEHGVPYTRYVTHDDGYWDPQYSWVTETFDEKVDEGFDLGDPAYHQFDVPLVCVGCPPISVCVGCDSSECANNLNMVCDDNEDGVDVDGISYLNK